MLVECWYSRVDDNKPWPCLLIIRCITCFQRHVDVFPSSKDLTARRSRSWHTAGRISLKRKQQRSTTGAHTSLYDRLESWWSCNSNANNRNVCNYNISDMHESQCVCHLITIPAINYLTFQLEHYDNNRNCRKMSSGLKRWGVHENENNAASRVSGVEWGVVYLVKLLIESDEQELFVRRVES